MPYGYDDTEYDPYSDTSYPWAPDEDCSSTSSGFDASGYRDYDRDPMEW